MQKRSLFLALAAGVVIWGFGALDARAAGVLVPLPSQLNQFVDATGSSNGNFTTVAAPNETETFSGFTYSTSPVGSPPAAADITLREFHAGNEAGLTWSGAFNAAAGTTVDYSISYVVTAPKGFLINDAVSSGVFSTFNGTGTGSIGETIIDPTTGLAVATLEISKPGQTSDSATFPGLNSILVQKDLILVGGSNGASISIFNQGFSSGVPEPASLALLGIGMTGFFAFRRFFKRTAVA
jgi:hypothetical protein